MKTVFSVFFLLFVGVQAANAHLLEELWEKYSPPSENRIVQLPTPGHISGEAQGSEEASFFYQWKYRPQTYEVHFQNPEDLARCIYSLALFAGDISPDLPKDKFYRGVTGFHYSAKQIADWLNATVKMRRPLSKEENTFAARLLTDGVVFFGSEGFTPSSALSHVLGAAPGKKRSFNSNLLHERLHVFWDENGEMRDKAQSVWDGLTEDEKDRIRKRLKNYNQSNELQLIEEWAIGEAEGKKFSIN